MAKPWQRLIPEAIHVRSWLFLALLAVVGILTFFIIVGIFHTSGQHTQHNTQPAEMRLATEQDKGWYGNRPAPTASATPAAGKPETALPSASAVTRMASAPTAADSVNKDQAETLQKAMAAPINANELKGETMNQFTPSANAASGQNAGFNAGNSGDDQNKQAEKAAFMQRYNQPQADDYLGATLQNPISPYELQAGTIIPGVLITGINSDLPGQITGQVRENVYDSISGNTVLIPQGAKVIGVYDSQIAYGQQRVLVAWKRIIFPNGQSIDLQGMPGVDMSGYAGFRDQVNNHYVRIFGSVVLLSILSAGAQLSQPQNTNNNIFINNYPTVGQTLAQSLGTNIANTGTMLTQKNINIQPTIIIRPGYLFNIMVTKDMVLPGAYRG